MKRPQLGHTVAILRRTKGVTQESLAKSCGINVRSLQRIESGEVTPRMYTLKQLSQQLDYDLVDEVNKTDRQQKKAWWEFSNDQDISQAMKTGWIAGILYFVLSIPETAMIFWRYTENIDWEGKIGYTLVSIAVMITAVVFYRGFAALGSRIEQNLITICAYLTIGLTLGFYTFDIYTVWWGAEREFMVMAELWCFGFTVIFFGIGLARAESILGSSAKIAAILDVIVGISFVLIVTSFIGLILMLPAIIAEIILLYKAYQIFGEQQEQLVVDYK